MVNTEKGPQSLDVERAAALLIFDSAASMLRDFMRDAIPRLATGHASIGTVGAVH